MNPRQSAALVALTLCLTSVSFAVLPPGTQMDLESKFFEVPAGVVDSLLRRGSDAGGPMRQSLLSPKEYIEFVRELDDTMSTNFICSPRMVARSGQNEVIESFQEFRYPTEFTESDKEPGLVVPTRFETKNAGVKLDVEMVAEDANHIEVTARSTVQAEGGFVTFSSGKTLSPDKPLTRNAIQQPIFTEIGVSVSLIVPKGNTLILGPFPVNRSFPSNSKAILKGPKQEHVKNRQPMVLFITLQPKCVEKQEAAINAKPLVPDSPVEISSHAVTLPRSTLATSAFAKHLPSVAQEGPNSTGDLPSHGWLAGVLSSEEAASVLQLPDIKVIAGPKHVVAIGERYSSPLDLSVASVDKAIFGHNKSPQKSSNGFSIFVENCTGEVVDLAIEAPAFSSTLNAVSNKLKRPLSQVTVKSQHTVVIASPSNALDEFVTFHLVSATVPTADPNQPQTKSAPQKRDGIPFGIAVPRKPGFITSPHAPDAGYVDVRGFPSGAEIKCPYSGKFLMVP